MAEQFPRTGDPRPSRPCAPLVAPSGTGHGESSQARCNFRYRELSPCRAIDPPSPSASLAVVLTPVACVASHSLEAAWTAAMLNVFCQNEPNCSYFRQVGLGLYYDLRSGLSARPTLELSKDLARDIAINSRMLAVGGCCNYRKSGIRFLAYRHVQRHLAEEGYAKAFRLMPRPTVRKNIGSCAATRAKEITHILNNAEHGNIHAFEHRNPAPCIDQSQILWRRDNHRALERHLLRHCKLRITGTGRHVDHHDVELAPLYFAQHLGDGRHHHRAAPDHRRFFVDQEANRHHREAIALDWFEPSAPDGFGLLLDGQQFWQRRPVNVGVEHAHSHSEITQPERQIDGRGRFSDAALAGGDGNDGIDTGNTWLHLVGWMGSLAGLRCTRL